MQDGDLELCGWIYEFRYGLKSHPVSHSFNLRRYTDVKQWDNGYIVVDAEYEGFPSAVEEYIDLVPILENLYLDPATVLSPIEEVRVA